MCDFWDTRGGLTWMPRMLRPRFTSWFGPLRQSSRWFEGETSRCRLKRPAVCPPRFSVGPRRTCSLPLVTTRSSSPNHEPDFDRRGPTSSLLHVIGSFLAPALLAVGAMPLLLANVGAEGFGLLSILWALGAYLGFLDLGMSRALTQRLASGAYSSLEDSRRSIWSVLLALVAIGLCLAIAGWSSSAWLIDFLDVPPSLRADSQTALVITLLTVPMTLATNVMVSVTEARLRFRQASFLLGPVLVLPVRKEVTWLVGSILVWRAITLALGVLANRDELISGGPSRPSVRALGTIWVRARWVAVSNVVGAVLTSGDRLIVGSLVGVAAIATYTGPFELTTRVSVLAVGFATILFPIAAKAERVPPEALVAHGSSALTAVLVGMAPVCLFLSYFAPELAATLLPDLQSSEVIAIWTVLTTGALFSALGQVPFARLHGQGRMRLVALTHLGELGPYIVSVVLLTQRLGLLVAAVACSVRGIVDDVVLYTLVRPLPRVAGFWATTLALALVLLFPLIVEMPEGLRIGIGTASVGLACMVAVHRAYPAAVRAVELLTPRRDDHVR